MREQLTEITGSGRLWATSRASYMIAVMDQLESGAITQSTATDWMWDVIRRLDDEADDPAIRNQIVHCARVIGQLPN